MSARMTLSQAIRADLARTGETPGEYARRRGVSQVSVEEMVRSGSHSPLAVLLASEIEQRHALDDDLVHIPMIDLRWQPFLQREDEVSR